jgi:putative transposase
LTEGGGIPLALVVTGAQRQEMTQLANVLAARVRVPVAPEAGAERHLCLDRGYDSAACRETAVAHGYVPHIPPKASAARPLPPPGDPGRHPPRRWVVEVSHSWCNRFRRVLVRWEKKGANYLGFVQLAACLLIYRKLRHARSLSG